MTRTLMTTTTIMALCFTLVAYLVSTGDPLLSLAAMVLLSASFIAWVLSFHLEFME